MAGIYVHIPFCKKACTYCDFHFSTNRSRQGEMVEALCKEIRLRSAFFPAVTVLESVYFGGGTPSVLSSAELQSVLEAIRSVWKVRENAEITLEANPDDLDADKLNELREAGINRLSIGIQSFRDEDLTAMNRSHKAQQAIDSVRTAQEAGFENITVDLIYGLPGLDMKAWRANIDQVLEMNVPHVSAYALTVEPKTALAHQVQKQEIRIPSDTVFEIQYRYLIERLASQGMHQYELSNFAKPGREAKHNGSYWEGAPYLGIGPSAHSFHANVRHWNHSNNAKYLGDLSADKLPVAAEETLTGSDLLNEYLMTGLRKVSGIDWAHIRSTWGLDLREMEAGFVKECLEKGLAKENGSNFQLTMAGFLVSDSIISNLFQVD